MTEEFMNDPLDEELNRLTVQRIICEAKQSDDSDQLIPIYEVDNAYLAPMMAVKINKRGMRLSKTILKKTIPTEQAIKLFVEGKTDVISGFASKKGRRFSAHLTLDRDQGKFGFEFTHSSSGD